ncbi:MAG: CcoQ/FixQ family Cbb3-type cytochrome c oxidase assembly chaperone [Nitrospiraceae bacterium]|nr:MAG: CcoQ/FixQ family Cbb3-type cytochrome c oxidase assembly chaperone [Nitrospiraceae bacterium]
MAYFLFGLTLVIILIVVVIYYFSKKRHTSVEAPKYKMLDDD